MLLVAPMRELCCVFFIYFLLLEAIALTGSVATEPARVGGVCLHFLHGT